METIDTGTDELLASLDRRVATVTLNRPAKRNALSDRLTPALRQVLLYLEQRPDVGCVVITGADTAFCDPGRSCACSRGGPTISPRWSARSTGTRERLQQVVRLAESFVTADRRQVWLQQVFARGAVYKASQARRVFSHRYVRAC